MGFARRQGPALGCWHRRGRGFGPATDDASAGKHGPDAGTRRVWGGAHRTEELLRGVGSVLDARGVRPAGEAAPRWLRVPAEAS
jgi:hypothetical protein